MADLTTHERDNLPAHHFALPDTRQLPIHDETHTRLAWQMVDRTHGLSDSERATARRNILHRAHELGMETSDWQHKAVSAYNFSALGVELPEFDDHPNRIPFSGVMTKLGVPSDAPVGGAKGKRVLISHEVARKALPSLIGMAVDFKPDFDGHDNQNKIGIITDAEIRADDLRISGYLYGADFPDEVAQIKKLKAELGFSYEGKCAVVSWKTDPVEVAECIFTGAAILFKKLAAYTTTSLEASAQTNGVENTMSFTIEDLKAALAAEMAPINARLGKLEASAASVIDKVKVHTDSMRACADAMEAAGVGLHAERGHVKVLRQIAGSMDAEAALGKFPHVYNDHSWMTASADTEAAEAHAAALADVTAQLEAANADKANLENEVKELKAAAFNASAQPGRQTEAGKAEKGAAVDVKDAIKAQDAKLKAEGKPTHVRLAAAMEMQFAANGAAAKTVTE